MDELVDKSLSLLIKNNAIKAQAQFSLASNRKRAILQATS